MPSRQLSSAPPSSRAFPARISGILPLTGTPGGDFDEVQLVHFRRTIF